MTVSVAIAPLGIQQFFDNQGNPNVNGTLLTQVGGVNYPTYEDHLGATPLPNPIPLNSRGEVSNAAGASKQLFLASGVAYTFSLYDKNGNLLNQSTFVAAGVTAGIASVTSLRTAPAGTVQSPVFINGNDGGWFWQDSSDKTSAENGGSYCGTIIRGTDYSTAGVWKRERGDSAEYNVLWWGADPTGSASASTLIQNALTAVHNLGGGTVKALGTFKHDTGTISVPSGVTFYGIDGNPGAAGSTNNTDAQINITTGEGGTTTPAFIANKGSSIQGFTFFWPNQSKASATPLQYGWAITTNAVSQSADNVTIDRIMLTNCYYGINMDWGGQWELDNIWGQTFNTLIRVDRQYDFSRIGTIHHWDFWATTGDTIYSYITANAIAINCYKADGLEGGDWRCFGANKALNLSASAYGITWAQIDSIDSDDTQYAVYGDDFLQVQIGKLMATNTQSAVGTSPLYVTSNVGVAFATTGRMQISQYTGYACTHLAIIADSPNAIVEFGSVIPRRDGGNASVAQYAVINEGRALVSIDGKLNNSSYGGTSWKDISGMITMGQIAPFTLDTDSSYTNFSDPSTWQANAYVTAITGGARFNLNTGGIQTQQLSIPTSISQMVGLFVVECDLLLTAPGGFGVAQFYLRISDNTINDVVLPSTVVNCHYYRKTRLRMPIIVRNPAYVFQWIFGGGSGTITMDVTNLKLWYVNPQTVDKRLILWVNEYFGNQNNVPDNLDFLAGAKVTYQAAAPVAGTHRLADQVINKTPTVGQPKGWICTVAGTPGTWVSTGNL